MFLNRHSHKNARIISIQFEFKTKIFSSFIHKNLLKQNEQINPKLNIQSITQSVKKLFQNLLQLDLKSV